MSRLTWTCEVCQFPIADQEGRLAVDLDAVTEVEEAIRVWKQRHPDSVTIDELMTYPDPVAWTGGHYKCKADIYANDYGFDVDQINTHAALLARTAHLLGKRWLGATDWDEVIRTKAGES